MAGRRPKNGTTLGFEKTLGQAADKMRRNLKGLGSMSRQRKAPIKKCQEKNLAQPVGEIVQQPLAQTKPEVLPRSVAEIVKQSVSQKALKVNHVATPAPGEGVK